VDVFLLDENFFSGGGLEVISEETSAFRDDGGGFVMFLDSDFEFFSFFGSFGI